MEQTGSGREGSKKQTQRHYTVNGIKLHFVFLAYFAVNPFLTAKYAKKQTVPFVPAYNVLYPSNRIPASGVLRVCPSLQSVNRLEKRSIRFSAENFEQKNESRERSAAQ